MATCSNFVVEDIQCPCHPQTQKSLSETCSGRYFTVHETWKNLMKIHLISALFATVLLIFPAMGNAQTTSLNGGVDVAKLQQAVQELTLRAEVAESSVRSLNEKQTATYWSSAAAIVAALLVAGFALINQKAQAKLQRELTSEQAKQGRLITAIEMVMQSRNSYEAKIRLKNLETFIPDDMKTHLETMLDRNDGGGFSGYEWDDLRTKVAETMAAKANSPDEVFQIWRVMLPNKRSISSLGWPPATN